MSWKRKVHGSLIGFIGFLLSPLSWWNDLFVNVPLAVGFGWLVSLIYRPAFTPAVVVGYWLTNVLGLLLMQKGVQKAMSQEEANAYSRRELIKDLIVSLIYTVLIVALMKLKIVQPITDYFQV